MYMFRIILLAVAILGNPLHALSQTEDESLTLSLSREFGYGGLDGKIQGTFSLRVSGPDALEYVEFMIDDQVVFTDAEAPFRYQFRTAEYPLGDHQFSALGYTTDGRVLESNTLVRNFISAEEGWGTASKIVVPILIGVVVLSLAGAILPTVFGRKPGAFQVGDYGAAGGAVCPRCELPFPRRFFSPNLVLGKLERCPHCGKIAIVARAAPAALTAAEERWRTAAEDVRIVDDEEARLQRMLEDSRFEE